MPTHLRNEVLRLLGYGYSTAGELTTTDYSDTTPDVTIVPDKLGRQQSVTNGLATSVFTYDPATLALDYETLTYDLNHDGTADFTRVLDRSRDTLGRDTGWQLKDGQTVENEVAYGYHATQGRLQTVNGGSAGSFTYGYEPGSSLLATVTGPAHTVSNTWEPTRDVLDLKQNQVGTTTVSGYDYTVSVIGQRTNVAQTGTAFQAVRGIAWGYDSLGQVISADSSVNTSDRAYQFDAIGNRIEARDGVTEVTGTPNYTANPLNQYTAVGSLSPLNDDDGNATFYPLPADPGNLSALAWDAENRLASATVSGTTSTYLYDAQSRRIAKMTGGITTLFVYDTFNCIAEYSGTALAKTYLWGLDLSGTLQGAGGVGGLLAVKQGSAVHFPAFDGNGNVSEYLVSNGTIAAHFEYDPFGNTMVNTDSSGQFEYRFSTKPINFETGLYYYQYRHYNPLTGRWVSRDLIEEEGGFNMYGFVENNGFNKIDNLGLYKTKDETLKAARDAVGLESTNSRFAGLAQVQAHLPKPPFAFNPGPMSGSDAVLYWLLKPGPEMPRFTTGVAGVEYSATVYCCPDRIGDHFDFNGPLRGSLPSEKELKSNALDSVEINGWPSACKAVAIIHSHTMTQIFVNSDGRLTSSTNFLPDNGGQSGKDLSIGNNIERYLVHEHFGIYFLTSY